MDTYDIYIDDLGCPDRVTATEVREQRDAIIINDFDWQEVEARAIAYTLKDKQLVLCMAGGQATCSPTWDIVKAMMEHEIPFEIVQQ